MGIDEDFGRAIYALATRRESLERRLCEAFYNLVSLNDQELATSRVVRTYIEEKRRQWQATGAKTGQIDAWAATLNPDEVVREASRMLSVYFEWQEEQKQVAQERGE